MALKDLGSDTPRPAPKKDLVFEGIDISKPNGKDLKWAKKIDRFFEKGKAKAINKELCSNLDFCFGGTLEWRVWYILNLRQKQEHPNETLSIQDRLEFKHARNSDDLISFAIKETYGANNALLMLCDTFTPTDRSKYYIGFDRTKDLPPSIHFKWLENGYTNCLSAALISVCREGTLEQLEKLVTEYYVDINTHKSEALVTAVTRQSTEFVSWLLEHEINPYGQDKKALGIAEELGNFEIAALIKSKMREMMAPHEQFEIPNFQQWEMMDDTTIIKSKPLPADRGVIREYFDFQAQKLRSVQEDQKGVHPLFSENFSDIQNQVCIEEAAEELRKQGGNPGAGYSQKSSVPLLKKGKPA